METREFYDVRSPETPSGLFDLRQWPERMRGGLIGLANRRLATLTAGAPELILEPTGFARMPEPPRGPNPQWSQATVEAHRAMEIAVGTNIPALVRLERVYRIQFAAFQPNHWRILADLFAQMPGWKGAKPCPHWFGLEGDPPPVLWGKIEAVGLRIRGEIQRGRWDGWDTWLRRNMHELPLL
jgi:hypothetical protein